MTPDGRRLYVWGWAREITHEMTRDVHQHGPYSWDRTIGDPEYTTTVEWAGPYRTTEYYPGARDWARDRELTRAARPELTLIDPPELEAAPDR